MRTTRRAVVAVRRELANSEEGPPGPDSQVDIDARKSTFHPLKGQFDLRAGVAAYAPIIAVFGSLSVPAIVLILTVPTLSGDCKTSKSSLALATGLLVIGMFGSLLGALAAAAIGAERAPTANLTAAAMYMAVPAMASVVSVLGAFEILVSMYAPSSTALFAMIVAAAGAFGVLFTSFAIADSPSLGPSDPELYQEWIEGQWLQDRVTAQKWARIVTGVALCPIIAAVILWWCRISAAPAAGPNNALVGTALGLTIFFTARSQLRATHAASGKDKGLHRYEAFLSCISIGAYTAAVLMLMPQR